MPRLADQLPLQRALRLAQRQEGLLARRQLYRVGVTRWQVQAQVRAGRWKRRGRQTLSVFRGSMSDDAARWCAVLEVGPRSAVDGVSALQAAGLKHIREAAVHVIAPKSSTPLRPRGVTVHESRRFREDDLITVGLRRTRPAVAAVHAALWARSDRQAALFLLSTVQQELATAAELRAALDAVRRHPRRALIARILQDAADGTHALGELDVLRALRRRGLPEPTRQAVRTLGRGRAYLDMDWPDWGLSGEIDGSQHDQPQARLDDLLRDLDVTAGGRTVLRIPLLAYRLNEEAVLDRLEAIFRARGWSPGLLRPAV